jgi:hypothetical protein
VFGVGKCGKESHEWKEGEEQKIRKRKEDPEKSSQEKSSQTKQKAEKSFTLDVR